MSNKKRVNLTWTLLFIVFAIAYLFFYDSDEKISPQNEVVSTEQEVMGKSTEVQIVPTAVPSKGIYFELFFTNPNDPNDNSVEQALIEKIDESKTSIDMAVFEFDIKAVAEAIIRAEKRGVVVRVVYDNEYTDPDPQMGKLKSVGIPTKPDNRSDLMHNKFLIFDGACIWTGSFNISNNASHKNNENAIYFCSPEASANYSTEFAEMYSGKFGSTSPSDTPFPTFSINGITVENCFAPEDKCMAKIINAVNTAESSIHFLAFSFTYDDLAKAMIYRASKGVTVEGVFETRGANTEYSECNALLNEGYDIRLDGNNGTMHEKVIIVDGKFVIFGSFNYSASADKDNDENLLIWYDPVLASIFEQEYQLMKSQSVIPAGNTCSK